MREPRLWSMVGWLSTALLLGGCASSESIATSKQDQEDGFVIGDGYSKNLNVTLEKRYGAFPKNDDPKLPLLDRGTKGNFVSVVGAVNHQGHLELRPGESILLSRVIWRAGGFGRFASPKHLSVYRRTDGVTTEMRVNMKEVLENPAHKGDLKLQVDDLVVVKRFA